MNLFLTGVLILAAFAGGYVLAIYKGPTIDAEAGKIEHKGVEYIATWRQRLGGIGKTPGSGQYNPAAQTGSGGDGAKAAKPVDPQAG